MRERNKRRLSTVDLQSQPLKTIHGRHDVGTKARQSKREREREKEGERERERAKEQTPQDSQ